MPISSKETGSWRETGARAGELWTMTPTEAGRETGAHRVTMTLIALSIAAIAANAVYAWHTLFGIPMAGMPSGTYAYVIILNAVFAAQCLITGGWGVGRSMRVHRLSLPDRVAPQLHRSDP